jgi:hypothetical protein
MLILGELIIASERSRQILNYIRKKGNAFDKSYILK